MDKENCWDSDRERTGSVAQGTRRTVGTVRVAVEMRTFGRMLGKRQGGWGVERRAWEGEEDEYWDREEVGCI